MFEVTGSRSGPKQAAKIVAGYEVAGPLDQRAQNLPSLRGKLDSVSVLAQFR
jgi:hypothetical protein